MKFLFLSDTHIRQIIPVGRIDDFLVSQRNKWDFIFKIAKKENIDAILQAGDLFDKPALPMPIIIEYIKLFRKNKIPIYCVMGQHDMMMRSQDRNKSIIGLLETIKLVEILTSYGDCIGDNVYLYGNNYNDNYENLKIRNKDSLNILVTHDMIGNIKLYPGQDITKAENFLVTFKDFQIILCGDYHMPFFIQKKGRIILNTGCLLRLRRVNENLYTYKPHFYTYNTETNKWKKYYVPIQPAEQVFDLVTNTKKDTNEREVILLEFVERLKSRERVGIEYMENLKLFLKENEINKETKKLIWNVLAEVSVEK